jgi:hypothetical protein
MGLVQLNVVVSLQKNQETSLPVLILVGIDYNFVSACVARDFFIGNYQKSHREIANPFYLTVN